MESNGTTLDETTDAATSSSESSEDSSSDGSTSAVNESGSTAADTSTTGSVVDCGCPVDPVFCESFEGDFDPDTTPWQVPIGGTDPTVVEEPVQCGAAALRCAAEAGSTYTATTVSFPDEIVEPGVHHISTQLRLEAGCLGLPTRVLQSQLLDQQAFAYGFEVWLDGETIELRVQDSTSPVEITPGEHTIALGEWYELAVDFDISADPPVFSVSVEGVVVIDGEEGPGLVNVPANPLLRATLGPFRNEQFTAQCAVIYDDLWAQ